MDDCTHCGEQVTNVNCASCIWNAPQDENGPTDEEIEEILKETP